MLRNLRTRTRTAAYIVTTYTDTLHTLRTTRVSHELHTRIHVRTYVGVLASAVDASSTALARTRTLRRSSSITQNKQHDMLPHHHS